ncbi:hypothetical protein O7627_07035 [Solwaraspora sp. WMMD1047]|uniref:hypothetical protein n=1 Tax=Solwaraspora sp. WMMD1047 TaxID=3016102 RepID=UPI002416060C|nr:hypothetical protein [Solwaraspora sp. WMMD1047]MDG4829060.1 hypothetical protein [Solwaraspora sp. WMMD1047]
MDGDLIAALARLREAFVRYPGRAVLDGCPHCRGPASVDDHDLFSLAISLGNTVGGRDDLKHLLPLLLERMVTSGELDPAIVLGKLPRERWRGWPEAEQDAIDGYLDAVWRPLLATYPSQVGSFLDPATFLDAVVAAGENVTRFLDVWDLVLNSAADRHLADTVNGPVFVDRRSATLAAWLRRETVRDRLYRAFERDHDMSWADDLARAYDLVRS